MIQKNTTGKIIGKGLNLTAAKDIISQRVASTQESQYAHIISPLVKSSMTSYVKNKNKTMDVMRQAILHNSLDVLITRMIRSGKYNQQMIQSATTESLWNTDNPITMLFNLMSALVPNFAFMEVAGVQPMPTKKSPIIYPQLSANEDRNGVTKGTKLLGTDGWASSNQYTSNKVVNITNGITGGTAGTVNAATGLPNAKGTSTPVPLTKVDIVVTASDGIGSSVFRAVPVPASGSTAVATGISTLNGTYDIDVDNAGVVTVAPTGVTPETLTAKVTGYYDLNLVDPAQVVFEWQDKVIEAEPRRIRSTYDLDNFYGAAKTLAGQNFDLDAVLSTTMAGYINKEISCDIFDNILDQANESFEWSTTPPTNTEWYWHQASVLGPLNLASNKIRNDIARSAGNIIVADTKLQTVFENIGGSIGGASVPNPGLWAPENYASQPIGPYVSGIFAGKYKVIFNQDFPEGKSVMLYKKDDLDAAYFVGVFLGLYSTQPLGMDTLNVVQGMGCQMGEVAAFPSAIKEISIVAA